MAYAQSEAQGRGRNQFLSGAHIHHHLSICSLPAARFSGSSRGFAMVPSGEMLCDFHIDLFTKVKEVVKPCNDSSVFVFFFLIKAFS